MFLNHENDERHEVAASETGPIELAQLHESASPEELRRNLGVVDKTVRALFVGCAVGIAWGIRGDFGGYLGAMYPGAVLGIAFAFVTGQRSMFRWMPLLGVASGLAIAAGGEMSYGVLHGYAKADTFINYSYGYLMLFCQGAAWGIYGCAALGLVLERKRLTVAEWASAFAAVYLGGFLLHWAVVDAIGFDVNPPRSNLSVAHFGGAIALFVWLVVNKRRVGLRAALFGFFGFGIAMFLGRLLNMWSYQLPIPQSGYWNLNEVVVGFLGSFVFTYGMLGYDFPDFPSEERRTYSFLNLFGILFVMVGIPLRHRFSLFRPEERLEAWAQQFERYGVENPEAWPSFIVELLNAVCLLAVVGAIVWIVIQRRQLFALRAFPVFCLTFLMMMYQKFHAHYFWYPRDGFKLNMHDVYWGMFAVMIVTAFFSRSPYGQKSDQEMTKLPWFRWVASTVAVYVLVLLAAGLHVNKDGKTMGAANTRFPIWVHSDGPFPGRE
jgi:hypothetical protein